MKVAVLGPSQNALELAQALHALGASVRLFWGGPAHGLPPEVAQEDVIPHPWLRVTKRFLMPGQLPPNATRFSDLFRVTYQVDPTALVQASKESQPEMFQNMSEEFLVSLKGQLEMFEDVDVVVDASDGIPVGSLGPGGPAVGELRMRPETLLHWPANVDLNQWIGQSRELALVGSGVQAQAVLQTLWPWVQTPGHRIFVITPEVTPFAQPTPGWQVHWEEQQTSHLAGLKKHAAELAEWEELDDFIKAKKPRPEAPVPPVVVLSAHMVTAVDQLVDQTRSFVTCEKIPWVEGLVQPENNFLELKTLGVDKIIGAHGLKRPTGYFHGLDVRPDVVGEQPERGFFTLTGDATVPSIIGGLMKLFSPRGADT
jgi:hypothetical protein